MDYLNNGFEGFCAAIDAINIPVLFCERFDERSDIWNFAKHNHDCIELMYFLYGNAVVVTGGSSVQTTFYDIVIYPKGVYHTEYLQYNKHHEIICVWVDIPGLEIPNVIRIQGTDKKLKEILEHLHAEYKSEKRCEPLIEHYVKAIAMMIARKCMTEQPERDIVSRIIMYLRDHMAEKITIQQIADLNFVSKSYLSRLFKRKTGMSIIDYLRAIRIETAKTILVSTEMSTEAVSSAVGYSSAKYFYRAFIACVGMSPREFRKREALVEQKGSRESGEE